MSRNLEGIDYLKRKTEKVYEDSFKHEKKLHKELSDLNFRVKQKEEEHEKLIEQLNKQNSNQSKIIEQIEGLEAILSKAKEFNTISEDLKNKKQARIGIMASVKDNFTRSLFDDQWLLLGFEDILKDLEGIYSKTEKERRKLQKEFHLAQGQQIAKRSLQDDLKNGIIPFPIGVQVRIDYEKCWMMKFVKSAEERRTKTPKPIYILNHITQFLKNRLGQMNRIKEV